MSPTESVSNKEKLLFCGDVCGNFKALFSRLISIIKKRGNFDSVYCVGDFFGNEHESNSEWMDLKFGKIEIPVTTYVIGLDNKHQHDLYESLNNVHNLVYLGQKGILTKPSGLSIAYLSSVKDFDKKPCCQMFRHQKLCEHLRTCFGVSDQVDILLTSQWPKGITKFAVSPDNDDLSKIDSCSSTLVADLAKVLKPRYHISGLADVSYERVPYRNHAVLAEKPVHVTRFIALASVGNKKSKKWMYAMNITPTCKLGSKELLEGIGATTVCPYESSERSNVPGDSQFFFETDSASTSHKRSKQNDQRPPKKLSIDSEKCWFCLSNLKVEKQLLITIGTYCYLTLPKGVLVPEHVLIVPVDHTTSSVELSSDALAEVEKFKVALASYFHDRNKDVVFFERNHYSPHLQIQVVPIPKDKKDQVESKIMNASMTYNLEFTKLSSFSSMKQLVGNKPFFYMEVMIEKKPYKKYLHLISKFPLQLGREILASREILNVEDRVDWKKCQDSEDTEKEMAAKMRSSFKSYDL